MLDSQFCAQRCDIETGWIPDAEKNKGTGPNTYDLLWFRLAKGEKLHFSEVRFASLHRTNPRRWP